MERDCCKFICGAPTTFQGYGIEENRNRTPEVQSGLVTGKSNSYTMVCPPVRGDNPQTSNSEWIISSTDGQTL